MKAKKYDNNYMARFLLLCYVLKEQEKFISRNPKYEDLCQNMNTERISQEVIEEYAPTVTKYLNLCKLIEDVSFKKTEKFHTWDQVFDLVECIVKDEVDI